MASSVLLITLYCGGFFLLAKNRFRETGLGKGKGLFPTCAGLLFLLGFTLRIYLGLTSEGFSVDIDTFKSWARITNEVGFSRIYRQNIFLDYPPGYLYVLTLLEKLRLALGLDAASAAFTLVMKLPSIFADLCCAGVLLYLGKRRLGEKPALFLSGTYLFCPAVFLNSSQWGQADSFCTAILLASVLLLYKELYLPSAILYGAAVTCKPQMLIFAPLYLFFTWKQRRFFMLFGGVACALATILLVATPFTQNFDYLWLVQQYRSTMDGYPFYSINAYNFWAWARKNWQALPGGALGSLLNLLGPVIATVLCGVLVFFSKRKDALFACPFLLMSAMYFFSVKMHERYLFPALLFLLLAYVFGKDRRLLWAFAANAFTHYLNVSYVLWQFQKFGSNYQPNTGFTVFFASLQAMAFGYLLFVTYRVYLKGEIQEGEPRPQGSPFQRFPTNSPFTPTDVCCLLAVTLLYGAFAFWHLGERQTANTSWAPAQGEQMVLEAEGACGEMIYLPGLVPDASHYAYRTGAKVQVETSDDGVTWFDCGLLTEHSVFAWEHFTLSRPGRYVRLTPADGKVVLNEVGLKLSGSGQLSRLSLVSGAGEALLDEPGTVPLYTTYENSTYFDEIYHARTAYEHILGLEIYETTHPPLGKLIISLGIRLFGMNPFGWRFMGALFGVLMLPCLYHLLHQLFGKPLLSTVGTLLFAFDFMHFTQTRIATIDTYAVFFLILMYDAMVAFLRRDWTREPMKALLPPLLCCGIFTGLGIASKWTAAYGALGLAVLFFGRLGISLLRRRGEPEGLKPLWKRAGVLCLWCGLFFLVIPFGIYFAAFLPLTTLPHNIEKMWSAFVNYQVNMFNYHSQLVAEHYFASPWYEWPLDIRPIWYFSNHNCDAQGHSSSIAALGNPLLWWSCLLAMLGVFVLWRRRKTGASAVAAVGFLSVYLPWTLVPRLTFIYHYFTATPFLVLGLMFVAELFLEKPFFGKALGTAGVLKRVSWGQAVMGAFVAGNLLLFALYFPVLSGTPTSKEYLEGLRLFPTWYF